MKAFQYCKSNQVKYHKIFYQSLSQKRNNQNWICARISLTSFLRYAPKNTHVDHLDPLQLHIHASYSCGNGMIFLEIQKSPKSTHDHEKNISKFFNTLVQYKTSLQVTIHLVKKITLKLKKLHSKTLTIVNVHLTYKCHNLDHK
jgi:hypothetical protein